MNTNLIKETNKICNLLMNILRKNTTVNFYERTGYSSRLGLNIYICFNLSDEKRLNNIFFCYA